MCRKEGTKLWRCSSPESKYNIKIISVSCTGVRAQKNAKQHIYLWLHQVQLITFAIFLAFQLVNLHYLKQNCEFIWIDMVIFIHISVHGQSHKLYIHTYIYIYIYIERERERERERDYHTGDSQHSHSGDSHKQVAVDGFLHNNQLASQDACAGHELCVLPNLHWD